MTSIYRPGTRTSEERRIARILEIIILIAEQPETWTRAELAQRYEVSERMIQKDLDIIRRVLELTLCRVRPAGYYFDIDCTNRLAVLRWLLSPGR